MRYKISWFFFVLKDIKEISALKYKISGLFFRRLTLDFTILGQMMPFYSYPNTWMYQGMAQAQAGQQQPTTANVNAHQRPQSTVTPPQPENGTGGLGGQPMQSKKNDEFFILQC